MEQSRPWSCPRTAASCPFPLTLMLFTDTITLPFFQKLQKVKTRGECAESFSLGRLEKLRKSSPHINSSKARNSPPRAPQRHKDSRSPASPPPPPHPPFPCVGRAVSPLTPLGEVRPRPRLPRTRSALLPFFSSSPWSSPDAGQSQGKSSRLAAYQKKAYTAEAPFGSQSRDAAPKITSSGLK